MKKINTKKYADLLCEDCKHKITKPLEKINEQLQGNKWQQAKAKLQTVRLQATLYKRLCSTCKNKLTNQIIMDRRK